MNNTEKDVINVTEPVAESEVKTAEQEEALLPTNAMHTTVHARKVIAKRHAHNKAARKARKQQRSK